MQKQMTILSALAVALMAVHLRATPAQAESPNDLFIVSNNSVAVTDLKISDVRAFFLKQRQSWPAGERAVAIHAKEGTPARAVFRTKVLEMTAEEETRYWEKQKIVRGVTPPTEFGTIQRAIFSLKGSIGYVLRKDHKDNVSKVLLVIPIE